ncbi:MAG TPA: hypothetical protein VF530_21030 [Planctomycetota bacterium]
MEHAGGIGSRRAIGAALLVALGASSSAQVTGHGEPHRGWDVLVGSLANDVRRGPAEAPQPTQWHEATAPQAALVLSLRLAEPLVDPRAVLPLAQDLGKIVTLAGGTPGGVALIEVGLAAPPLHLRPPAFASAARFTGVFGPMGQFSVELPPALDLRGLGARGADVPGRSVTAVVDLDAAAEEAFASWSLLGRLSSPDAAGRPGDGRELRRPSRGVGHTGHAAVDPAIRERELGGVISCPVLPPAALGMERLGRITRPAGAAGPGQTTGLRRPERRGGRVR